MGVRGALEDPRRATHLGKGCARFIQPPSNLDDGILSVIGCSSPTSQIHFAMTD